MNNIEFSLKPLSAKWKIVSLIFASMLFDQARTWTSDDERIPTAVMLFAVMDICSRENQSQRNTILIDDVMSFGSQLSSIRRVFPYFFPPSQELRPFDYPKSATATLFLSDRHTLSGSGSTSFGTLLLRPIAESTCELSNLRSTLGESFSTDIQYAKHTTSHSTACVVRQAVSLVCIPSSLASEYCP
jgi:hypothetical protein